MITIVISPLAKCKNTVDYNTTGATEQQIWHKKYQTDWILTENYFYA